MPIPPSRGKLPHKGIYRDTLLRKFPDGYSPDIMAMVVNKVTSAFNTEPGNEIVSSIAVTNNLTIQGVKDVLNGQKILLSKNGTTHLDEIGILDADYTYTPRIQEDLGFDINFPFAPSNMQVEYNFQGDLILAFTDNLNTPKIVNLTHPPSPFVLSEIELFPSFTNIKCSSDVIENGGSLKAGAYFPAFRYQNNDGTSTAFGQLNNPVFIVPSNGTNFNTYEGSIGGASTTKSIQFTLTNVDTTYDRVVLAIVYKANGELIVSEITSVNTGSTVVFTYTGSEQVTSIDLAAITTPPAFYTRIAHLTQVQGTLYGADVSESSPINLQKYANLITVGFKSTNLNSINLQSSYKVNAQNNKLKAFAHQEVYALYLIAKLKSGGWTQAVAIPGRAVRSIQGSITGLENDLNTSLVGQDGNLATDIAIDAASKYYQTRDTTQNLNSGTFTGDMGFWENEDEVYPSTADFNSSGIGGADLRGQKVRHHRFPSIKKCKDNFYSSDTEYGKSYLDALSIIITSFPTIPSDILDQIEGFEILYAERSYANMTVAGNDLLLNCGRRQGDNFATVDTNPIYTASGNWTNSDLSSSPKVVENIIPYHKFIRLHSFNLLLNKPAINPAYISNHFVLNYTNISTGHLISYDTVNYAFNLDYTDNPDSSIAPLTHEDEQIFAISNYRYIPNNVLDGQVNNYRGEAFIFAEIANGNNRLNYGINGMHLDNASIKPNLNGESVYYSTIMLYRKNIYNSFYGQNLVSTGLFWLTTDSVPTQVNGGDIFISLYGFVTFGPRTLRDIPGTANPYGGPVSGLAGVKVIRAYIAECTDNIGFRYEVIGDDTTKYYPKETIGGNVAWFLTMLITTDPNNIAYDKDFSLVNNVNPFIPINPYAVFQADHPYRIIRSAITSPTEEALSWRTFLANDFFEIRKDKGPITNIQGINYDLLINLQTTILQTIANQVMNAKGTGEGATEVYVGTGDIFQRVPTELQTDSKGVGGCQHKFSCLLTPEGYFFVDSDAGKIFLVDGKLKDITTGMYSFFLDNLKSTGDNPYLNTGLTVAWDSVYKRIILCQLDINPFNWYYTPERESWTARSPYAPRLLFNDRTGFYSLDSNGVIWKHNAPNKAKWYGTIYPSWVIIIDRILPPKRDPYEPRDVQSSGIDQWWYGLNWKTEVLLDGVKLKDKTIDQITIWDSYQSTGDTSIIPFISTNSLAQNQASRYNTRRIKDRWIFNKFRDLVIDVTQPFIDENYNSISGNISTSKNFILKKRFADDFIAIKFLFTNQLISSLQPDNFLTDAETEHLPIER